VLTLCVLPFGTVLAADAGTEAETCLACHGDKDLSLVLPSGEAVELFVDPSSFAGSVHSVLSCTDCHKGMGEYPHPERQVKDAAAFRAGFREACKSCHFDTYTKFLDGVHDKVRAGGDASAPSCTDCHGAHDIVKASSPRTRISETCAGCHFEIYDVYVKSVHGKALEDTGNGDVPVCTDCHRSHDIRDPKGESWLVRTPEMCGKCHGDETLMKRYELSTAVTKTYLADFHGTTASMSRARSSLSSGAPRVTALCIDCHGVHDIAKTDDPESRVLKANLVKTCRQCHAGATDNFPAAWLSHYEPSWQKAPLVYGVKVFYQIFIPFIIGGLCLQILLHLWRVVVNR
jgi:nitrate/TMAO reductase-like tetraheme cytochrome c subunit